MILENMILDNVKNMPPSGIRKYFDLINEMDDVISLGVGEPDFVTPWNVREAGIYSLEQGHTHYSSNAGFIELREEISKYLNRRFSLRYNPKDEILVTVGGSEGIDLALRALVGPGDEVIIPEPSFVAYKGCTAFTGAIAKTIDLRAEDDFKLTPELLEEAITEKTKVVIIPFPNNPTGAIMNKEELQKIVDVLKDKDVIIISDEIYAELSYDEDHVSIASFPEVKEKTIVINGFSKAYAMTGWRLGYVCAHKVLIDAMKKIHQYAIMCSPTTAQYAAIEALKNGDESVAEMAREYNRRRRVLVDGFRSMGLDCFEPLGALYVFPCIKSTGMSSDEFCEKLLLEEKVLAVPGNAFGECGEGFIRACYAASMEDIMEAIKRIRRFVERNNMQGK
ncbi:aminotransferase class I/II-fold pyridoxal phosphate-dependent enzyme [Clostridium perfringens]|uniref:aminotransferase class I/II-fold pyridoxal phosphate-dependent enzyme n=1 Tax=Clostridium perfringens TaxID=1502 RepID=UPI0024BD36A0|nr:aminotransferase class I/II-fold pyridoxal phosphate-dependent enzyme [Clostridium perfringens]EGT3599813.1 aminotransferase class I/II-fold pyridoxal phosphate-dependent enzyme [Clostridium perfringens]ELC8415078.1 aminotransferase class I/II-fold pyridoxal phosphate-dependent enzyme [Clostridium perfringens]MDK0538257.1 aminotransferase class I/II-fold pyridoxal phosphate-dependent enzyme [Clostridium perfringens]MDK0563523.1 aminotransferase class I/II-fold pyridoxal phosphate-dependent e